MEYPQIRKINHLVWHIDGKQVVANPDEPGQAEQIEPFVEKLYWKYKHLQADYKWSREEARKWQARAVSLKGWISRLRKEIAFQISVRSQERLGYYNSIAWKEEHIRNQQQTIVNIQAAREGAERTNKTLMDQNKLLRERIAELETTGAVIPSYPAVWKMERIPIGYKSEQNTDGRV